MSVADCFGFGGKPWFGYWDSVTVDAGKPYLAEFVQIVPGGAAFGAGIRDGDRVDIRDLDAYRRFALLFQPVTQPMMLPILRNGTTFVTRVIPTTQFEISPVPKITNIAINLIGRLWLLGCALLLWARRRDTREGRYLCVILIAAATGLYNVILVTPSGAVDALANAAVGACCAVTIVLSLAFAAGYGKRPRWRVLLEALSLLVTAAYVAGVAIETAGILTARVDPLPLLYGSARFVSVMAFAAAAIAVAGALSTVPNAERARAAWLLLPMPLALALGSLAQQLSTSAPTYLGYIGLWILASGAMLAGAAAVTYALLARRVMDLQFFIGRTLVVAGISGIVVVAFTLLEWLLGTVVTSAGHATGLAANAALALVLGLSMSFIHKRVDRFVDLAFFRKRYEDERALHDFSKEAAFVTRQDDLLDRAIEIVRHHTDASSAAILLDGLGTFEAARSFGDEPPPVSENDPLILALKARHEPLDPHRYATALTGDLAVPMLARGRLLGAVLLGARATREAYVADEVDAMRQFCHGVGSALDALESTEGRNEPDTGLLEELRALRAAMEQNIKSSAALTAMLNDRAKP
ncbi:MAG TPA: GAF domain-containing protein [Candidatus Acidoferrales bacterium]|nr:GAF domain-containing protein [Candidatus Acidoferrales bacterium]